MSVDLGRELAVAERIAREAGALVMRYFGAGVAVDYKEHDEGPVTRADREANALLVDALAREFPGDGLLSEEIPDDGRWRGHDRVWMVDPLDGTKDFIRGRSGFAVMLGLCVDGRPALGVVYRPTTGVLYRAIAAGAGAIATAGGRAERVDEAGRVQPLSVSTVTALDEVRLVASASHRTEAIDRVRAVLGVKDELNLGSVGLKLGLIAEGTRDLYVNPASRSSLWDSCGPEAILVAAGGRLSDLAGRALDYRGPEIKNSHGLVASNGVIHARVVEKLAELWSAGAADR